MTDIPESDDKIYHIIHLPFKIEVIISHIRIFVKPFKYKFESFVDNTENA